MAAVTTTESGDAVARREQALELSGWGQPFTFFQPHNLCFWVYLAISAVGLVHLVRYFGPGSGVVGTGLAAGTIAVAIYGLLFLAFLRLTDHYERQPRKLVLAAFLWGGIAGTFGIALTANTAMLAIYPKLFGQAFGADWSAALTAPFSEETGKAAGFILLLGLAPRLIRSAYDGVFIGAFIGLGFQLFENVLYSFNTAITAFGVNQTDAALGTFAARAFSGVFSHTLFSALFCCGLVFAIGTAIQPRRLGLGIGLMVLAMIAHGMLGQCRGARRRHAARRPDRRPDRDRRARRGDPRAAPDRAPGARVPAGDPRAGGRERHAHGRGARRRLRPPEAAQAVHPRRQGPQAPPRGQARAPCRAGPRARDRRRGRGENARVAHERAEIARLRGTLAPAPAGGGAGQPAPRPG